MKRLSARVNLVPVIAKSDTMTEDEIKSFKTRVIQRRTIYDEIMEDIAFNKINIYQPPIYDNDDPETIMENKEIIVCDNNYF